MKWRYDKDRRRLNVMNPELDLSSLRSVINKGLMPNVKAIVYTTSTFVLILRGHHLRRWIAGETLMLANPS
jgi:hypothetical protein